MGMPELDSAVVAMKLLTQRPQVHISPHPKKIHMDFRAQRSEKQMRRLEELNKLVTMPLFPSRCQQLKDDEQSIKTS